MSDIIIPAFIALVLITALTRKTEAFSSFLKGASDGMHSAVSVFPSLLALVFAVYMLRASGFIELFSNLTAPILNILGIPPETAPLILLKPFSGSGSLALGADTIRSAGVDTYAGRVAAVMLGSCETTFYAITVYFGSVGVTKTRYVIPCAVIADITAFIMSAVTVKLFF